VTQASKSDNGADGQSVEEQFEALYKLARDKSAESRKQLIDTIGDLFLDKSDRLDAFERTMMYDILRKLVSEVEISVRHALANRLAKREDAPPDLIVQLANDEIEVALPVLLHSSILRDVELVEIIHHRTLQHQLAIALRAEISEEISDALAGTDQEDVLRNLLNNKNAKISRATMEYLIEKGKWRDKLHGPLLSRPDLEAGMAKRLYWYVSTALRKHILDHYQVDPSELDDQLETTVREIIDGVQETEGAHEKAQKLARQLHDAKALDPALIVQILRRGEITLFECMMSELTGLRMTLLRRLLYEPGGEGLAIAAKDAGFDKPTFASVFLLSRKARPGDKQVDPGELSTVLEFFESLDQKAASEMVRRWRRDPEFLEAQWKLESDMDAKPE